MPLTEESPICSSPSRISPYPFSIYSYLQSCLFIIATIISGGGVVPQAGHQDKVLTVEGGHRVGGHANFPHRGLVIHDC